MAKTTYGAAHSATHSATRGATRAGAHTRSGRADASRRGTYGSAPRGSAPVQAGSRRPQRGASQHPTASYVYPTYGTAAAQPYEVEQRRERGRSAVPPLQVSRGAAQRNEHVAVGLSAVFLFIALGAVLFTLISFARIALVGKAVVLDSQAETASSVVVEMQADASALELRDSSLSDTARIQEAAEALKMQAPAATELVTVSPDVIATNEDGSLSLAGSVRLVESNQARA